MPRPVVGQIALNIYDYRVRDWYARVFGFVYAGATDLFFGPTASRVQGIPGVVERCKWLIDSQAVFQLEFFKFLRPRSTPRRPDARLSDIGYQMMGIHVRDFDAVLAELARAGTSPITEPMGPPGDRRVCVRDPEGNLVEVFERDPVDSPLAGRRRPEIPATVRVITVSVPDLDAFKKSLVEAFELDELARFALHDASHERLWGLAAAVRRSAVLRAGSMLIELVQYESPAPRPRPDGYRICDQGYMNMALVLGSVADFDTYFARAVAAGWRPNGKPLDAGVFKVMYVNDPHGFSVELLYPRPWAYRLTGFTPSIPYIEEEVVIAAPPERVWEAISDHARITEWAGFPAELLAPGKESPNGVGALRRVKVLGSTVEEEIVESVAPLYYVYRLLRGAPLRNHRGTVMLLAEGADTRVRWAVGFESMVPGAGWALASMLGSVFHSALDRLRARLES